VYGSKRKLSFPQEHSERRDLLNVVLLLANLFSVLVSILGISPSLVFLLRRGFGGQFLAGGREFTLCL
jgi:hypothetical protein